MMRINFNKCVNVARLFLVVHQLSALQKYDCFQFNFLVCLQLYDFNELFINLIFFLCLA